MMNANLFWSVCLFVPAMVLGQNVTPPDTAPPTTTSPPSTPNSSTLNIIRPVEALFEEANALYLQKQYAEALHAFSDILPQLVDSRKEEALYHIADCCRLLGKGAEALGVYDLALKSFPESVYASNAWFHVGQINYQGNQFDKAVTAFTAAQSKGEARIKEASRFYIALCDMQLKQQSTALPILREFADAAPPGPYAVFSAQTLAAYFQQGASWQEALKYWRVVLDQSKKPALQSQAAAQAGWVAFQSGDMTNAESLFLRCRQIDDKSDWTRLANTGLIQLYFQSGRYKEVIDCFNKYREYLLNSSQPEVLLDVARSNYRTNNPVDAVRGYDVFLAQCKGHPASPLAAYERLLAHQQLSQEFVGGDAIAFLATYPKSELAPYVLFLRALDFSRKRQFIEAKPLWLELKHNPPNNVPGDVILLELERAQIETQSWEDVAYTASEFIQKYPQHPASLSSRVNLAVALQNLTDPNAALEAWKAVRSAAAAGSNELQTAYEQIMVLLVKKNAKPELLEASSDLLKNCPRSNLRALASYTLGAAAFDSKNYDDAETYLQESREWDAKTWNTPALYRLTWIAYVNKKSDVTAKLLAEYDSAIQNDPKPVRLAAAFYYWLGNQKFERQLFAECLPYLNQVIAHPDPGTLTTPSWWLSGEACRHLKKWPDAVKAYETYRHLMPSMVDNATVLLALAECQIGAGLFPLAQENLNKVLLQQPEGLVNAKARLLLAKWNAEQNNYVEAAKCYSTLALIFDDPVITPQAMEGAAGMWQKAGDLAQAEKWKARLAQSFPNPKFK